MASAMIIRQPPTSPFSIVAPGKEWGVEPVELLVQRGVTEVPEKFRRVSAEEELSLKDYVPCPDNIDAGDESIPVIDLGHWEESHRDEVVRQVREACEEWGFFRIVNHGVSLELMDRMMAVATQFMALPIEEKAAYVQPPGMHYLVHGYGSKYTHGKDDQLTKLDWRDFLSLLLQPPSVRDYAYWPSKPAEFNETMDEYSRELKELAMRLLGIISEGLGERTELLVEAIGEPYQKMLINYYPACPQPKVVDGFHQHSDIGALTLVMQEENAPIGLEVRHNNKWVPAIPIKGSFVVNVADQVEILTNGRYKSIEHRVVPNQHKSRLSIAIFYDPAPDAVISPLRELTKQPMYKQAGFDDYEIDFYEYGADSKNYVQSYIIPNNVDTSSISH